MRNIFITGGAGYLGRAFLRKVASQDVRCTIFSRDHGKHAVCHKEFPYHQYIVGDIRDYSSVEMAMAGHDTVIHAAAFKYVPEAEINVTECHEINVMGSINVARAAMRMGVDRVVGLSTDKACQPINVYGMTKLMMEKIFQEADRKGSTQFNLVRYGNVVSSTGSAIPIFRRQAREDGVIKLTNPDMTRFWLSVDKAVGLIMQALEENQGGTVLIPRLSSLNLLQVAHAAASIEFGGDCGHIQYETIGKRFGEKVDEDLLGQVEAPYAELADNNVMRLYPMTTKPRNYYSVKYSSDHPDRFLTVEEAINLIEGSPS